MRRSRWLIAALVVFAALAPATASAQGPGPNVLKLRAGDAAQRGVLSFYEWTARAGRDLCVTVSGDGPGDFPKGLSVPAGPQELVLRIHHRRPTRLVVRAWTEADGDGNPTGDSSKLPFELVRHDANDRSRGWDAIVDADVGDDLFLAVFARWQSHPPCRGPRHLEKHFHVVGD